MRLPVRAESLSLRGEAGIGKSALLGHLLEKVAGWHVATAVGVESEMELAYSGLHQLCGPMLDHLDRLPAPQREALATVFGLSSRSRAGPVPGGARHADAVRRGRRAAAAASASSTTRSGSTAPRRRSSGSSPAGSSPSGSRSCAQPARGIGDEVLAGLPELSVDGLGDSDARALLLENVYGPLDAAVCDQIVTESHGNPLALLELPRSWSAADLAGGFGLPGSQPVASKIEQSYVRRLRLLPSETQLLVLAAAAEPLGDPVLLHRAAETLGIDMAAADPAVDAGLLKIGGRVEFAHPLVRSAAYRSAAADDRHRVHRALADATDAETRPGSARLAPRPSDAWTRTRKSPPSSSVQPAERRLAAESPRRPHSCSAPSH